LGFKTPNEVFMQSLNRVALRVWIYRKYQYKKVAFCPGWLRIKYQIHE
jgi:hypothetical protein